MRTIKISNGLNVFLYGLMALIIMLVTRDAYISLFTITILEVLKQIKNNNFFTSYTFWILGYLFIICLDGVLLKERVLEDTSYLVYYKTSILFHVSLLIIIFYYRKLEHKREFISVETETKYNINAFFIISIMLLYVFYMILKAPEALESLGKSRFDLLAESELGGLTQSRSIITTISYPLIEFSGFILPSLIFVGFLKNSTVNRALMLSLVLSLPIWFIHFGLGTRHYIVYSFLGLLAAYALIKSKRIKFRYYYIVFILFALLFSKGMLEVRKYGFINYVTGSYDKEKVYYGSNHTTDLTTVYMSYAVEHHLEKPLYYGKSTTALVLFWIPRKIWKEKPTQFGYWFIREYYGKDYKGFSDKHSAPASYLAAPYSDFGYLGVILISLLISYILNKVDVFFRKDELIGNYKKLIFISFFLASAFFLPRQLSHLIIKVVTLSIFLYFFFFLGRKTLVIKQRKE